MPKLNVPTYTVPIFRKICFQLMESAYLSYWRIYDYETLISRFQMITIEQFNRKKDEMSYIVVVAVSTRVIKYIFVKSVEHI